MTRAAPFSSVTFTARVVKGAGRGRNIGTPTLNIALSAVPRSLGNGIYACRVRWNRKTFPAAMHFGPRPVFNDSVACEVHIIGHTVRRAPLHIRVEVVQRIRNIRNFKTVALLQQQILRDVIRTKMVLRNA